MATSAIDTEKWETGIDATATDIKEVKAFVDWRLSIYKENGWKGFDLWESFVDDFESFTRDILNDLGKDRLKEIRDYLRKNRVYTRKEARKSIADGLLKTIHEPTPLKWPADDPTDDTTDDPTDDPAAPSRQAPPAQAPSAQAPLASPSNDHPPTAELPLPTNFTAPPTNVAAPPTDITAPPINVTAPPIDVTAPFTNVIVPSTNAPNTRPTEAKATTYGRDLATLAKMYMEESKYNREDDNLDRELTIFNDFCDRAKIPQAAKIKGLPTMLRSIALNFYYGNKQTYMDFLDCHFDDNG